MRLRHSPELPAAPIELVLLEPDDAPLFAAWLNDPEVTRGLQRYAPLTLAAERKYMEDLYQSPGQINFGIWLRSEERLIGACDLHGIDSRRGLATFGIMIGEKAQRAKGFGTHATMQILHTAFARYNLRMVLLHVYGFNTAAQRCYAKCGFREVGRIPEAHPYDFTYHDEIIMAVRREDWIPLWKTYTERPL